MTIMQPEITITSKEIIKPSSPTPYHLRTFKLSLMDQINPRVYVPIAFYYPNSGNDISYRLKNSLSKTLTKYYPLAGRIKNAISVECNDEGVDYFEAHFQCSLSEILQQPTADTPSLFFPGDLPWNDPGRGSLLVVKVSFFDCGGMAIAACISHKIADAYSVTNFMSNWAAVACGHEVFPEFVTASIFPPSDRFVVHETELKRGKCVSRRYVFNASKIAELKAVAANSGVQNPTRVEVVTALIYKCAMAASIPKLGISRPFALIQTVNLRTRILPPLPENSVGNLSGSFLVSTMDDQKMELPSLVGQLREGILQFCNKYAKNLDGEEWSSLIWESKKERENIFKKCNSPYICSSWCRFPLYQVDFGWGKPIWVSTTKSMFANGFLLMDSRGGDGIEAWVGLEESDMAVFDRDEEFLAFASLNSSVLDIA